MDYGLALPNLGDGAGPEGLIAAAKAAEEHGFTDVWTTDHLLIDRENAADYGRLFEAITTLAWLAGQTSKIRLGTSVVIAPMRNAVVLAKELATVDALSGGRLIAGFGAGWNTKEFGNVGVAQRFRERGAYLEETIAVCRHLWSGTDAPFHGRFHDFEDYAFEPLPAQGGDLPIWLGARDERALRRVGRVADAYHASATTPAAYATRIPIIRAAAEAAGRPMPRLSARARLELDAGPQSFYTIHGSAADAAAEIRAFAALGVDHLALWFPRRDPDGIRRAIDRFRTEVAPLV
jgi:probable F420-dependent oxidoreductase